MAIDKLDAEQGLVGGDFQTAPIRISVNANSQVSAALPMGVYEIVADVDYFFVQGASTAVCNTATSTPHWSQAGVIRTTTVSSSSHGYIAAAVSAGTGTVFIAKKGPVLP